MGKISYYYKIEEKRKITEKVLESNTTMRIHM